MRPILGRLHDPVHALFRVVVGFLFACHGSQKLFGFPPAPEPHPLTALMLVAGVIELVGGVLIALGLMTSIAAFLCSGQMAVAYFMAHAPQGFLPIVNQGELAVLYCFAFLFLAATGGGRYSLDGWLGLDVAAERAAPKPTERAVDRSVQRPAEAAAPAPKVSVRPARLIAAAL